MWDVEYAAAQDFDILYSKNSNNLVVPCTEIDFSLIPQCTTFSGLAQVSCVTDRNGEEHFLVHKSGGLRENVAYPAAPMDKESLLRLRHGSGSSIGEDFITEDFVDDEETGSDENSNSEDASISNRYEA